MITFAWPWLLLMAPLPLLVYFLPAKAKPQAAKLYVPLNLPNSYSNQGQQRTKKNILAGFMALIWLLCVLAVSRPQWLGEAIVIPSEGREMMIAVDLSGSMQIEDMQIKGRTTDRLTMLKYLLGDFIERRSGDRLGLILFADDAYMQTPMTFDRKTVSQMLDESFIGLVGQKTAIGDAIGLAAKRFEEVKNPEKVLILLTDGQNTAGKLTPDEALSLAVGKGITIYTIGIGADVMIEKSFFGNRKVNPSADLDENTLTKIAKQTGGRYFRARDSQEMAMIYQLIDELEPVEQEQQKMRPLTALFYYPLGLAVCLVILYFLIQLMPLRAARSSKSESKVKTA